MEKPIQLLRIQEAAKLLGVSTSTLRKWDNEGKLLAVRISKRGDRRYRLEDIETFLEKLKK